MHLKGILTERHFKPFASFQIVTEWEDEISQELGLPIKETSKKTYFILRRFIQFKLEWLFLKLDLIRPVKNYYLHFGMQAQTFLKAYHAKGGTALQLLLDIVCKYIIIIFHITRGKPKKLSVRQRKNSNITVI